MGTRGAVTPIFEPSRVLVATGAWYQTTNGDMVATVLSACTERMRLTSTAERSATVWKSVHGPAGVVACHDTAALSR